MILMGICLTREKKKNTTRTMSAILRSLSYNSRRWDIIQSRSVSIKTLPWCAPVGFPNRKGDSNVSKDGEDATTSSSSAARTAPAAAIGKRTQPEKVVEEQPFLDPIKRFGIVSAMSKNRVIGINGKLPWDLPEDRQHFKDLTRDKVLIIGRKTYHDTPNELNIRHARKCIVVSKTAPENLGSDMVQVARSFPEALHVAKQLSEENSSPSMPAEQENNKDLDCWVGGGAGIYAEALNHPSASELHLTLVDITVDVVPQADGKTPDVALFPVKYRWDRYFEEASRREVPSNDADDKPSCSYIAYRSKKRPAGANSCQTVGICV